jgi:hypothetical protein
MTIGEYLAGMLAKTSKPSEREMIKQLGEEHRIANALLETYRKYKTDEHVPADDKVTLRVFMEDVYKLAQ